MFFAACQVMLFGVNAAFGGAHANGPIVLAAHHNAFNEGLAAYVGFKGAVLVEGARKFTFLFCCFRHESNRSNTIIRLQFYSLSW